MSGFSFIPTPVAVELIRNPTYGALASAIALGLWAFGYLHEANSNIPLIMNLVNWMFGQIHLALQIVCSFVMAIFALANMLLADCFS